jgi:hypothetical protein
MEEVTIALPPFPSLPSGAVAPGRRLSDIDRDPSSLLKSGMKYSRNFAAPGAARPRCAAAGRSSLRGAQRHPRSRIGSGNGSTISAGTRVLQVIHQAVHDRAIRLLELLQLL